MYQVFRSLAYRHSQVYVWSVCVAVYVPGVLQPGLPALTGVCVCVWSVCVAVHVPGVPQPGLPALTGVCVCVCV